MTRRVAASTGATTAACPAVARGLVAVTALAVLAGCGADTGSDGGADVSRRTPISPADTSPEPHPPTQAPHTRDAAQPGRGDTPPSSVAGAEMSEPLRFGTLQVRPLAYRRAGFDGAATGTRVDIVTVEECAAAGFARVRHRTWHLVDAAGEPLGFAGGNIVNGNPTEDLPVSLSPGQCIDTKLAIGVPAGSTPVAVKDGPDNTWVLAD
ncbi:MAG: hypothetical protein WKF54_11785 [Nocardioidaceae bacterium]